MPQFRWNDARRWNNPYTWTGSRPVYRPPRLAPLCVLLELENVSGLSVWFSDGRYADTAAGIVAQPRIAGRVRFQRTASTPFWSRSARAVIGIGAVDLLAADGGIDWLLSEPLAGKVARLYIGPANAPLSQFKRVARCIVDKPAEAQGDRVIRLSLADGTREFDVPVTSATVPAGANAGEPIGLVWGKCFSVPARQWAPPDLEYALQDAAPLGVVSAVRDRGAVLTPGTQWVDVAASPLFGIELLQNPAGRITVDCTGQALAGGTLSNMLNWALGTRLGLPSGRLDSAGYASLQTELQGGAGNYLYGDPITSGTWAQAFDRLAGSFGGWWWVDADDVVRFDRLRVPVEDTPDLVIDERSLAPRGGVSWVFDDAPGLRTAVLVGRNAQPLGESDLTTLLQGTADGARLTRAYRERHTFSVHPSYTRAADRQEGEDGMASVIAEDTGQTEAARRASLYDQERGFWKVPVLLPALEAFDLPLGALVKLVLPRYGAEFGAYARLVDIQGDLGSNLVELKLWGSRPGPEA